MEDASQELGGDWAPRPRRCDAPVSGLALATAAACALMADAPRAELPESFQTYIARGYFEIADYAAARLGDFNLAAHFQRRAEQAEAGTVILPEPLDQWHLATGMAREVAQVRRILIARLEAGARQRQPLLAAIAKVNLTSTRGTWTKGDVSRRWLSSLATLSHPSRSPNPVPTLPA